MADQWHHKAFQQAQKIEESDSEYWADGLSHQRGKDMVLLQALPAEVQSPSPRLSDAIMDEAFSLGDGNLLKAWSDRAWEDQELELSQRVYSRYRLGDYQTTQGHYQEAVGTFLASESIGSIPENLAQAGVQPNLNLVRRSRIVSQLVAGNFAEARRSLSEFDRDLFYSNIDVDSVALADLAESKTNKLSEHFTEIPASDVATWLVESPRRRFFEQQAVQLATAPDFESFLDRYPMPIGYHQSQQSAELLLRSQDAETAVQQWTTDSLSQNLSNALGVETQITTAPSIIGQAAWTATSAAGDRFLISIAPCQTPVKTAAILNLPESSFKQLDNGDTVFSAMTISVLDYEPQSLQRLFSVASQLAEFVQEPLGFLHNNRFWPGNSPANSSDNRSLSETLRWDGRVPITSAVVSINGNDITSLNEETGDDDDLETAKDWQDIAKKNTETVAVIAEHSCGLITEELAGELVRVDADKDRIFIRLKEDSSISRYLRKGNICTCHPSNLRLQPKGN